MRPTLAVAATVLALVHGVAYAHANSLPAMAAQASTAGAPPLSAPVPSAPISAPVPPVPVPMPVPSVPQEDGPPEATTLTPLFAPLPVKTKSAGAASTGTVTTGGGGGSFEVATFLAPPDAFATGAKDTFANAVGTPPSLVETNFQPPVSGDSSVIASAPRESSTVTNAGGGGGQTPLLLKGSASTTSETTGSVMAISPTTSSATTAVNGNSGLTGVSGGNGNSGNSPATVNSGTSGNSVSSSKNATSPSPSPSNGTKDDDGNDDVSTRHTDDSASAYQDSSLSYACVCKDLRRVSLMSASDYCLSPAAVIGNKCGNAAVGEKGECPLAGAQPCQDTGHVLTNDSMCAYDKRDDTYKCVASKEDLYIQKNGKRKKPSSSLNSTSKPVGGSSAASSPMSSGHAALRLAVLVASLIVGLAAVA